MNGERLASPQQLPPDNPLWEKTPGVLERGHHLESMPVLGERFGEKEDVLVLHESVWWGISMGSLVFAVRARHKNEALDRVASHIGISSRNFLVLPSWELYPDVAKRGDEEISVHEDLDERYPDRDVVRVLPFSIDEYKS